MVDSTQHEQPANHRVRNAVKECLFLKDNSYAPHNTMSIFFRTPEKLGDFLQHMNGKCGNVFKYNQELSTQLRTLGSVADYTKLQDNPLTKPILGRAQSQSDIWLLKLPARKTPRDYAYRDDTARLRPEETIALYGITLNTNQTSLYSEAIEKELKAIGIQSQNCVMVERGEDRDAKCAASVVRVEHSKTR